VCRLWLSVRVARLVCSCRLVTCLPEQCCRSCCWAVTDGGLTFVARGLTIVAYQLSLHKPQDTAAERQTRGAGIQASCYTRRFNATQARPKRLPPDKLGKALQPPRRIVSTSQHALGQTAAVTGPNMLLCDSKLEPLPCMSLRCPRQSEQGWVSAACATHSKGHNSCNAATRKQLDQRHSTLMHHCRCSPTVHTARLPPSNHLVANTDTLPRHHGKTANSLKCVNISVDKLQPSNHLTTLHNPAAWPCRKRRCSSTAANEPP
jgi:hypothetical protein